MPTAIETRATVLTGAGYGAPRRERRHDACRWDVWFEAGAATAFFSWNAKQATRSFWCFLLVLCRARFPRPGSFSVRIGMMAFVLLNAGHF